jgi:hypothetical protein
LDEALAFSLRWSLWTKPFQHSATACTIDLHLLSRPSEWRPPSCLQSSGRGFYESSLSHCSSISYIPLDLFHAALLSKSPVTDILYLHPAAVPFLTYFLPLPRLATDFTPEPHLLLPKRLQTVLLNPHQLKVRHRPPRRRARLPLLPPPGHRLTHYRPRLGQIWPPNSSPVEHGGQHR